MAAQRGLAWESDSPTWGGVTNQILALRDHLIDEQVTLVSMEATSDHWKACMYTWSCRSLCFTYVTRMGSSRMKSRIGLRIPSEV